MERSRDSRSPPLNMYRYKSRVEASRGETSHLTKRRVDSSRGKARLPLLSLASLSNSTRFRSFPFRARYILIRPTGGYHLFRGPARSTRPASQPCCRRLWPQGCFPRAKDLPLVPNFSATHRGRARLERRPLWPRDRSLLSSSRCICSLAYLP